MAEEKHKKEEKEDLVLESLRVNLKQVRDKKMALEEKERKLQEQINKVVQRE